MPDAQQLQILVESDLEVASAETPRRVLEAMRRHLRQHAATGASGAGASESPLTLIQTREGRHRMPQALLPALTETCRRQGVAFSVVDRRAMVACPALRSRRRLRDDEQEAVRRLLLRDCGVLLAESPESQRHVAVELLARRQQRTLIAVDAEPDAWLAELVESFGLEPPVVAPLRHATAETRIAVGRYPAVFQLSPDELLHRFGMVVFAGLSQVDAVSLLKLVRSVGARYLLGLASSPTRSDGLQGTIYLALGDVGHVLATPSAAAPVRMACRFRATEFDFPYQGRSQYQALLAALARDPQRAELVAADIAAEVRAGQGCLVLSERRDHLEQLAALLPEEIGAEMLTSTVRPPDRTRSLRRFEAGEVSVLFATGQIITEAVAAGRASRLFLTFPFAYMRKLEEPVRRLLAPHPGKTEVLVFDYDDARVSPLHRAFDKRRSFLERLAGELEEQSAREAQMQLPL